MAGIKNIPDMTDDLERHIIKNNAKVQKQLNTIRDNLNPFDPELDKELLFSISTGKAVSAEIACFLTSVNTIGKELKNQFIT